MANQFPHSVLVTGATGDIGRAVVDTLVTGGAFVFCAGRNLTQLEELNATYGSRVMPLGYDITDDTQVKEAFRKIQKSQSDPQIGPLYGLVNGAGVMRESALAFSQSSDLLIQLQVNFVAAYTHMQLASRLMTRQRNGSIVNLVSQVGEQGAVGMSAYAASKAALTGATKSLAKELAPLNIRVNAVSPGFIDTRLTAHYQAEHKEQVIAKIAMGRAGCVQEVAAAVSYLLSTTSSYTTGHILPVDGGFTP